MNNVIKMFHKSNNGRHSNARYLLEEAMTKDLGDKVMVISMKGGDSLETNFLQCGMTASEMIALLEVVKLNIYSNYMKEIKE